MKLTRKDRALRERQYKIDQILNHPEIGEPKRYRLKLARGVHVNPFVIVYMIVGDKIVFLWFDHHDQAYDKAASVLEKVAQDCSYLLSAMMILQQKNEKISKSIILFHTGINWHTSR